MRTIKIAIATIVAASCMMSCVPSRKYKAAISERDNLQSKNEQLKNENSSLLAENQRLNASAVSQQTALKEREKTLSEEEQRMKEMKALIDEERNAIRNLKQEVCSALKCFTPDELQVEVRNGKLYVSMSDKLLFPSGSDVVNKRGVEAIGMLAHVLTNSNLEIMVEGHTDTVPINTVRNKDNWDLSVHRATSVTREFIKEGIPPQRIIASGESKFHPVAENETAEGRQLNRRTDIVLAPKLDKLWKLTEQEDLSEAKEK